jgi:hypothetical protein
MAALFSNDREMARKGWECHANPEGRLAQQPLTRRISKKHADYEAHAAEVRGRWPAVAARLSETARSQNAFMAAVQVLRVE